jgi:hypothetical protein
MNPLGRASVRPILFSTSTWAFEKQRNGLKISALDAAV